MDTTTLTGHDAIRYATATGANLSKYADPIDGAREIDADEALRIAAEDPALVHCAVPVAFADRLRAYRIWSEVETDASTAGALRDMIANPQDAADACLCTVDEVRVWAQRELADAAE